MTPFQIANAIEAVLWWTIGVIVLALTVCGKMRVRSGLLAAVTLATFGVSDIVEMSTGAWWRPWWLFLWKVSCVAVLLAVLIMHRRRVKKGAGYSAK